MIRGQWPINVFFYKMAPPMLWAIGGASYEGPLFLATSGGVFLSGTPNAPSIWLYCRNVDRKDKSMPATPANKLVDDVIRMDLIPR